MARAAERGVELEWFGAPEPAGFTSAHALWRYVERHHLPRTVRVLATLMDMRLPPSFEEDDVDLIAAILAVAEALAGIRADAPA